MAIPAGAIFEARATATANMVNSGGFNPANANFLTDLTTDADTGNTAAPVVSSASYSFVAGDVGAWVFIQAGTNWTPGWYYIDSVAGGKATLNATIGEAVSYNSATRQLLPSTVLGVATVATPTGGTFGIDYSQQDAAKFSYTDLVGATTSLTSAANPFNPVYVGNFIHITSGTGFTAGWYEIVSVSVVTATIDRSAGTTGSSGVATLGGALSFNSTLDDEAYEMMVGGNVLYFKSGTFTIGEAISVAGASPTAILKIYYEGYNSVRGDRPLGSSRPVLATGSLGIYTNLYRNTRNLIITGTSADVYAGNTVCHTFDCKIINTSTTASRNAYTIYNNSGQILKDCEIISQNGYAVEVGAEDSNIKDCYIHDSVRGLSSLAGTRSRIENNVFENCDTDIYLASTAYCDIEKNTFYGQETPVGVGINLTTAPSNFIQNNIFYGKTTAITQTTAEQPSNIVDYNNYYNNTTNRTLVATGPNDLAVNPQFAGAVQITGSTATSSGSVLTQAGGDFSTVEDNVDHLTVVSGTGVTVGKYLITSHDATTLTVNNALGTSAAGDIVYRVGTGHNFAIGTNLKAAAHTLPSFGTTSYVDLGAVQREEPSPTASSSGNYSTSGNGTAYG